MTGRKVFLGTVLLHEGVVDRFLALRETAGEPLIRLHTATTAEHRDRYLVAALRAADTLAGSLIQILAHAHPGQRVDLLPDPDGTSIRFRTSFGYSGHLRWEPETQRFQIDT